MRREEKSSKIVKIFKQYSRNEEYKVEENRSVFKILFRTCHYIIKKMMSNQTYESLVKLISKCGSDVLQKFMIKSPKNATYLSHRTFSNLLKVLNDFTEEPLLKSLKEADYVTLFHDETTDVSNHSEAAVFVMFSHEDVFKEHFLGIIHMTEGLTALDHYTATLNLCKTKGLDLAKVQFVDLDGCNTNAGDMQGLKLYFRYHNPHNLHQTCNSHTLALIPKHKITDSRFRVVADADKLMINLHVLFKNSCVKLNIFEKSQIFIEDKVLKLVSPSATRWLSHERCFVRIMDVFEGTLIALAELYEVRGDVEAMGLMIQLSDPQFVLTALMLIDMLRIVKPLTLWLQSSPSTVDATQLPVLVTNIVNKLDYIAGMDDTMKSKFTKSELEGLQFKTNIFEDKIRIIADATETLPAAARLRTRSQEQNLVKLFSDFVTSVQQPFVSEIAREIKEKISLDPVTAALICLDVRHFPDKSDLENYGKEYIETLCNHFGKPMQAVHPKTSVRNRCDPKIDASETLQEYELFKMCAFQINADKSSKIKQEIRALKRNRSKILTVASNKKRINEINQKIEDLEASIGKMPLSEMYRKLCEPGYAYQFPNILVLLEIAILCPVGNATVERLFSFMKIVKTRMRNSLGDQVLDSLLRIKTESKEELTDEDLEELVDMFKQYLISLSKSGDIRVSI